MSQRPKAVLRDNKDYKEEFLSSMNWVSKSKARGSVGDFDVSLTFGKKKSTDKEPKLLCMTLRNEAEKLFADDNEYIQICIHKNRMFFRQADSKTGYKLYDNKTVHSKNRYVKFPLHDVMKAFVGDYDMKYDDFLELYYIEKE